MLQRPSVDICPKWLPVGAAGDKQAVPAPGAAGLGWTAVGTGRGSACSTPRPHRHPFASVRAHSGRRAAAAHQRSRRRKWSRARMGSGKWAGGVQPLPCIGTHGDYPCCSSIRLRGFHSNRCLGWKESGKWQSCCPLFFSHSKTFLFDLWVCQRYSFPLTGSTSSIS